mgnify:CR=1 FL=1
MRLTLVAALIAGLHLTAPAATPTAPAKPAATADATARAHQALQTLFDEAWESEARAAPEWATLRGDLRFISNKQEASARNAMREIVAKHLPGTSATITFEDGNPAMPPTKGNSALLATLDSVSRALGQGPIEPLDPGERGAGDISFISDHLDALDGLGVIGFASHSPDERVDLRSIGPATERAAVLIYRLTR